LKTRRSPVAILHLLHTDCQPCVRHAHVEAHLHRGLTLWHLSLCSLQAFHGMSAPVPGREQNPGSRGRAHVEFPPPRRRGPGMRRWPRDKGRLLRPDSLGAAFRHGRATAGPGSHSLPAHRRRRHATRDSVAGGAMQRRQARTRPLSLRPRHGSTHPGTSRLSRALVAPRSAPSRGPGSHLRAWRILSRATPRNSS
jgi:hypothetical protein